jgi:hypothetical protein
VGLTTGAPSIGIAIPRPIISAIRLVTPKSQRGLTDQLNDPHASVLPAAANIKPRSQLEIFTVGGWPLEHAEEFLIKKGHDLSGPIIIMQFPSWDSDRREFVPTPLVELTDGRAENDDRSGDPMTAS